MPLITRLGDKNTGHDACPPVALASGSEDVRINNRPVGRVGDVYEEHGCDAHKTHQDSIIEGFPHLFVNGLQLAGVGHAVSNGSAVAEGSPNCSCGGRGGIDFGAECGFPAIKACVETSPLSTEEDKLLVRLPEIAEEIAVRDCEIGDYDYQGWKYIARELRRWLTGDGRSYSTITEEPFIVDTLWSVFFYLGSSNYIKLSKNALSENGKKLLFKRLKQTEKLGNSFGETIPFDFTVYLPDTLIDGSKAQSKWDYFEKLYVNTIAVNRNEKIQFANWYAGTQKQNPAILTGKNGLLAGIGSFSYRALAQGNTKYLGEKTYRIQVERLAIYIRDEFDFEDDKMYGFWSYENKDFGITAISGTKVTDITFKNFRKKYGKGRNFYIFSDPVDSFYFEPVDFIYTEE